MYVFGSIKTWLKSLKLVKNNNLDDEHYPSILVTFLGGGGRGGGQALRRDKWSIKAEPFSGKPIAQHKVQKPREHDCNCNFHQKECATYVNKHTQDLKGHKFK